ncbi:MAG: hypothetical protein RSA08_03000, partial [Clostridia bacterium]
FASINQVVFKMDMGYINEYHIKALEVVNEFGFVTSRQVTQILDVRGKLDDLEEDKKQNKVAKWLEDLTKSKVVARYCFQSEGGKSSFRVYSMDKIATYILKQRNISTSWQPTDNTKPAYAVKRKLAGNQIIIAYMQKVAAFNSTNPNVLLFSKKYNVKFKPTGGLIELKQAKENLNFVFEVVRRNEDWQNMFAEKVQLYSDFYENFNRNDAGFYDKPQLVFVGEDVLHIAEMFRIIKKVSAILKDEEMYFTTELKHLDDNLENTINVFELEKETKKYKLVVKPLDILKPGDNKSNNDTLGTNMKFSANMIVE